MQSAFIQQLVPSLDAIRTFATGKGGAKEELQAWAGASGQIRTLRDDLLQVLPTLEVSPANSILTLAEGHGASVC
jgi:hypothetical protein